MIRASRKDHCDSWRRSYRVVVISSILSQLSLSPQSVAEAQVVQGQTEETVRSIDFDGWSVRETRQYVGNLMRPALRARTRYYLRPAGTDDETLAYEMTGSYAKKVVCVQRNGDMILTYGHNLTWVPFRAEPREEWLAIDDAPAWIARCWDDCMLLAVDDSLRRYVELYVVPITESGQLGYTDRLRLTDNENVWTSRASLQRVGGRLIWLSYTRSSDDRIAEMPSLGSYDFNSGEREILKFEEVDIELLSRAEIAEFDGRFVTLLDSREQRFNVFDLLEEVTLIQGYQPQTIGQIGDTQVVSYWVESESGDKNTREFNLVQLDPIQGCHVIWSKTLSRYASPRYRLDGNAVEVRVDASSEERVELIELAGGVDR